MGRGSGISMIRAMAFFGFFHRLSFARKVVFISKREVFPFVILESYVTILKSTFINAFCSLTRTLKCVIDHQIQQRYYEI